MKPVPLPVIVFPPELSEQSVHDLLQWLHTLTRTIERYYADPLSRLDPNQTQLNLWEEDDLPF